MMDEVREFLDKVRNNRIELEVLTKKALGYFMEEAKKIKYNSKEYKKIKKILRTLIEVLQKMWDIDHELTNLSGVAFLGSVLRNIEIVIEKIEGAFSTLSTEIYLKYLEELVKRDIERHKEKVRERW